MRWNGPRRDSTFARQVYSSAQVTWRFLFRIVLLSLALEHHRDFIDTLSKAQKEVLTGDIDELETFLTDYFVPADVRSLIIFKSGEDGAFVVQTVLPVPYSIPMDGSVGELMPRTSLTKNGLPPVSA